MRVLAAMSGGVDSAVAAALAVEAGHEVVGVHMALSRNRNQFRTGSRGCCSIEDASDARRAADILGIPYYVWDLSEKFEDTVVADFVAEYEAGRTPNPCVRCNEHIKFEALLDKAMALGFDAVATGHYAQVIDRDVIDASGETVTMRELHRSPNDAKDQSYVLAVMGPERLRHAIFPLGGYASKDEVRAEAERRGLSVSNKPDSYDICFVADGDTKGFLRERLGSRPGEVLDTEGNVVGEHDGAYAYTVGQRKGLALGRPAPDGQPRYVLGVSTKDNTVIVGPSELLSVNRIVGDKAVWFAQDILADASLTQEGSDWFAIEGQVRAHGAAIPGRARVVPLAQAVDLMPRGKEEFAEKCTRVEGASESQDHTALVEVELESPLRGVAAGQSIVLFRGTRVVGQATVVASDRHATLTNSAQSAAVSA
ncbi:tRNA 2-thiouridine(34) synthase MnmA [Jonesia quinghaiensis]|uniref:tRNA 2-thiouridine(34) synthase MnmA n=1 Tax=Jonesia quinghaiensis TaxID=262806 RepID=UPI000413519F|nr:tRNA 2-thiouridine(34) synthase MnmA [Jonesia quinghaiensis]